MRKCCGECFFERVRIFSAWLDEWINLRKWQLKKHGWHFKDTPTSQQGHIKFEMFTTKCKRASPKCMCTASFPNRPCSLKPDSDAPIILAEFLLNYLGRSSCIILGAEHISQGQLRGERRCLSHNNCVMVRFLTEINYKYLCLFKRKGTNVTQIRDSLKMASE